MPTRDGVGSADSCPQCGTRLISAPCRRCNGTARFLMFFKCRACGGTGEKAVCPNFLSHMRANFNSPAAFQSPSRAPDLPALRAGGGNPASTGLVLAEGPHRPPLQRSQLTPARAQVAYPGWLHRWLQYPFVTRTDERVHVGSLDFRRARECVEEPGDAPTCLGGSATPWLMPFPTPPRPAGLAGAREHPARRTPYRAGARSVQQGPR
jgi:hypothetical protein